MSAAPRRRLSKSCPGAPGVQAAGATGTRPRKLIPYNRSVMPPRRQQAPPSSADQPGAASTAHAKTQAKAVFFDPSAVRPWRFHNRAGSGMADWELDALAESIKRNGQQQPGLARRLPPGDTHAAEVIFGVRRLEACRRAGVKWRAEVRGASLSDAECAALMHSENAWTENISPLENAVQWQAMLDEGVFSNQSALAAEIGCHRGTVARAVRTSRALFAEEWLARLVRPVMHQLSGRAADRLADACASKVALKDARRRAKRLSPGHVTAERLHDALFGKTNAREQWRTVFMRRRGRGGGGGAVAAKIARSEAGGWSVTVQAHEQSPADLAELAEKVEGLLQAETAGGAGVRFGRKVAASLSAEDARNADRSWLEGCVWAWAHSVGLDWDRMRCALAAQILRTQPDGWRQAVVQVVQNLDESADSAL